MSKNVLNIPFYDWRNLEAPEDYLIWRDRKIAALKESLSWDPIQITSLDVPGESAVEEIRRRLSLVNYAVYRSSAPTPPQDETETALRKFAATFGLKIAEEHRSAAESGLVALKVTHAKRQAGYIPYSNRAMNWHTDGYYNAPDDRIGAFLLHCARPALTGGANQLIDPELAYIRLRDENPDHIRALSEPDAMTIPENVEEDGSVRPASVGPVFLTDGPSGRLIMRYTARTRSISWADRDNILAARDALAAWLQSGDPLLFERRMTSGEGVLNNNVLHNRTSFENGDDPQSKRVIYRVRFSSRVEGT